MINWVAQPCEKGDVYITMPYLLYRVKGPLTGTWRIILLQFIGIQDNYNNLKAIEGGTQAKLVNTHQDLKAPPYTLFRHTNLYSAIPYYFPAAVELIAASALFNALLGK